MNSDNSGARPSGVSGRRRAAAIRRLLWFVALAAVVGAFAYQRSRPARVETVVPILESVTESIAVIGRAQGVEETDVSPSAPGRVSRLLVREGDRVRAGEPLATLDNSVEAAGVQAAAASLLTAQAQLRQASAPTRRSDLTRIRAEAAQAKRVAQARLKAAEARLAEMERGVRPEQIQAAESALQSAAYRTRAAASAIAQARARLEQADLDVTRKLALVADGAVSQSDADRARTGRDEAEAALSAAEDARGAAEAAEREAAARLAELKAGTRRETLEAARAEVAAARATLEGAARIGPAQVETAVTGPRAVDIAVARRRVDEAQRSLELAEAKRDVSAIRAPVAGMVTRILAYPGAAVSAASPLLRLVPTSPLEVVADVDEKYLGQLQIGLDAIVTSDAFPGKRLQGRVTRIGAQVDRDRGSVEVHVLPLTRATWLRPGQSVSVNIVLSRDQQMLTVPLTAVVASEPGSTTASSATVLVVENRTVRQRTVRTAAPGAERIPIVEGLGKGDQVVLNASGVKPGRLVEPVPVTKGTGQ